MARAHAHAPTGRTQSASWRRSESGRSSLVRPNPQAANSTTATPMPRAAAWKASARLDRLWWWKPDAAATQASRTTAATAPAASRAGGPPGPGRTERPPPWRVAAAVVTPLGPVLAPALGEHAAQEGRVAEQVAPPHPAGFDGQPEDPLEPVVRQPMGGARGPSREVVE